MPDAIFSHPRLARVYDAFDDPRRPDLPPYLALLRGLGARSVVDVGCGTGCLALLLAAHGSTVTGADPARASLDIAAAKPGAGAVTWRHAGAADLPALDADAAVMTGNVAQVFLSDEEFSAALLGAWTALRPGGHLVFETRRPQAEVWREWAAASPATVVRDVPGVGVVRQTFELTGTDLPLVSFRGTYSFEDGEVVVSDSTLRFRTLPEIEEALHCNGFQLLDVRQAPDRPGKEFVVTARRGGSTPSTVP